jgi:hypothetical protein
MRNLLLAAALAFGLGVAATGAPAAPVSGNVVAVDTAAKTGNSAVEKTYYRRGYYYRRHWRHRYWGRPYWRHRYYRRHYYGYRPYWRRHRYYDYY